MSRAVDTAALDGPVLALSGGIGGAKLVLGLSRVLAPERLTVVANTGDDFEHLGLAISPDLDTLMYTLAGLDNPATGWGRRNETWTFMSALAALGGQTWFRLGDGDLATHVERTRRLATGNRLSQITRDFCHRLGVTVGILPMSDDRVRTRVSTSEGWLDFQDYFVRRRCEPRVLEVMFEGADSARPQPEALAVLRASDLRAVIICPSNPFLSIDPILAVAGMREAIAESEAPVVAISPIIGNRAVKGPTAKMMDELGLPVTAAAVARHYGDLIDGYVIDHADAGQSLISALPVRVASTLMVSLSDRQALAREVMTFAGELRRARTEPGARW